MWYKGFSTQTHYQQRTTAPKSEYQLLAHFPSYPPVKDGIGLLLMISSPTIRPIYLPLMQAKMLQQRNAFHPHEDFQPRCSFTNFIPFLLVLLCTFSPKLSKPLFGITPMTLFGYDPNPIGIHRSLSISFNGFWIRSVLPSQSVLILCF